MVLVRTNQNLTPHSYACSSGLAFALQATKVIECRIPAAECRLVVIAQARLQQILHMREGCNIIFQIKHTCIDDLLSNKTYCNGPLEVWLLLPASITWKS